MKNLNSTPAELIDECNEVIEDYNKSIDLLNASIADNNYYIESMNNSIGILTNENIAKNNKISETMVKISMENEIIAILQSLGA